METVMAQEIPSGEGLTLEKLWAYHFASKAEFDRRQAEYERRQTELTEFRKETERMMQENAERMRETDERMRETDVQVKKTTRTVADLSKNIGKLGNSFGELTEHLVAPGLRRRFAAIGLHFSDDGESRQMKVLDGGKECLLEIDICLENDDAIIAVEVKSRPDANGRDVAEHVSRIEKFRKHRDDEGLPPKRIMGAIAGAVFNENAKNAARKAGFFVLEQSGDTIRLDIPEGFVPREW